MKKVTLLIFLCSLTVQSVAQHEAGDIQMAKSFWGVKFQQDGRLLKPKGVLKVMENNPAAYGEFKKAKANYTTAQVLSAIGGFMVGWPLGTALAGGDPEWGLAAGGAGLILLAIPFTSSFTKHANAAIELYNSDPGSASLRSYSLHVIPYGAGAKFILKF